MKQINLAKFIRTDISKMEPYLPVLSLWDLMEKYDKPEKEILKLNQGENPYGFLPNVAKKLRQNNFFNFYPDPEYKRLRIAISKYVGLSKEYIMVGAGVDELLDLVLRLILNEGDEVINCPPTFGMYTVLIQLNKGKTVSVPRNIDFSLNIKEILNRINKKTKAIFVCSPNNPTGNIIDKNNLTKLLKTGKLIIVDEAYFEFCNETAVPLISQYKNLIVLRTFSKWAGLAGLRLGYAIMSPYLIKEILKIKLPFNVNLAAEVAGIAALNSLSSTQKNIREMIDEREKMYKELCKIPYFTVYPSEANFLLIQVNSDLFTLKEYLESKQIIVRFYWSEKAFRLSIGTPKQNNQVINVLKKFNNGKISCDGIIFDVDGVLIDVKKSFLLSIKKTTEYILGTQYGKKVSVTQKDIETIKGLSGFNNDWDASYALIDLFVRGIPQESFVSQVKTIDKKIKKSKKYEEIRLVFDTFYWGSDFFIKQYKTQPPFANGIGCFKKEKQLIKQSILVSLAKNYSLGIVTGRNKFEVNYGLLNFKDIAKYIPQNNIITSDDTPFSKPHPAPILKAKKQMNIQNPIYIGDSIDDVLAAKAANIPSVYIGEEKLGDYQLMDINQIKEVLQ